MTDVRAAAYDIACAVAERLSDPAIVAAVATASWSACAAARPSEWRAAWLSDGHPGIAVFLAEMAHVDPRWLPAARAHLAAAATHLGPFARLPSLHIGMAGIGFAATAVSRSNADCAAMIAYCDRAVRSGRINTADTTDFDVIKGTAGVTRYLLHRADPGVRAHVRALIRHAQPKKIDGCAVPGWLLPGNALTLSRNDRDEVTTGLDLGLAHGIAGSLACLAIAADNGVDEAGLVEAIDTIATWLAGWYGRSATGNWPMAVRLEEEIAGGPADSPDRAAWCYGTPGIAAALHLAAAAVDRPEWSALAATALDKLCANSADLAPVDGTGLCHGWAGLLHIVRLVDNGPVADELASRIVESYDDQESFGFRYDGTHGRAPRDIPGLLGGAAGTAAALLAYATGEPPRTGWDKALLLR
ncbi:lanthionine synthetase LanC family protein [Fodinicola acaciae]|uniref:lanthionine synthetase LanC family protein n=1 Tax=Fodinicola acaciae TaxID=2681555 RepID=UPI0013D446FB|nr:lanthionine synthetase LanC family protein [Fodinicola acaciae]